MTAPGSRGSPAARGPGSPAKRLLDVLVAGGVLLVAAPVMAVVALGVRARMGAPVLFRQTRPGLDARPFELLKFRTMTDERDADGALLPSRERLTGLGRFLRRTSLDELPQLLNVLRGDMSLVGPRPLLMDYLPYYSPEQARRHQVRPGITGLAQVRGRNTLSWEERFALDVEYVDTRTLWLDLRILALTAGKVLLRRGTTPSDGEIMTRFDRYSRGESP